MSRILVFGGHGRVALLLEPLLVELLLELPQPAAARAPIAHRASGILLMSITTPPRVDPS